MVENGIDAILIKTATIGLNKQDIGKSIIELHDKLCRSETLYGCNPCGEGGEYETFTLDSPLYKKRIVMYYYSLSQSFIVMIILLSVTHMTVMLLFIYMFHNTGILKRNMIFNQFTMK